MLIAFFAGCHKYYRVINFCQYTEFWDELKYKQNRRMYSLLPTKNYI